MTADDVRQDLELKVVELLKKKVEEGTMTEERSQQLAQLVLEILKPAMSMEELMKVIPRLDDTAPELSILILPYLRQYEEMIRHKATKQVSELIKVGQYESAAALSKKIINQDDLVYTGSSH